MRTARPVWFGPTAFIEGLRPTVLNGRSVTTARTFGKISGLRRGIPPFEKREGWGTHRGIRVKRGHPPSR